MQPTLEYEVIKAELQNVLSQKEYLIYYAEEKSFLRDWFLRFQEWLITLLQQFFPRIGNAEKASSWIAYGIGIVLFLLVLLTLYYLLSKFVRRRKFNTITATSEELAYSLPWHLSQSTKMADQKQYTSALRHLFLGLILFLDNNQWIDAQTWKTNGEYMEELQKNNPDFVKAFYAFALLFEEASYGGRSISQEVYRKFDSQVREWIRGGNHHA